MRIWGSGSKLGLAGLRDWGKKPGSGEPGPWSLVVVGDIRGRAQKGEDLEVVVRGVQRLGFVRESKSKLHYLKAPVIE